VVFNTCHSGEISPTLGAESTLGDKSLPNATADALLSTGSGRVIITACREEQFSYIGRGALSLFTQALVDTLHGEGVSPRGGFISAFDLYTSLYESVKEKVLDAYGRDQEPELTVLKTSGLCSRSLPRRTHTNLSLAEAPAEISLAPPCARCPQRSQRLSTNHPDRRSQPARQCRRVGGSLIGEQRVDTGGGDLSAGT
jgi:hypothetical protein